MSLPAIKVEGLWKEYTVGAAQQRNETFYDLLANSIKVPFNRMRNFGGKTEANEQFWALRDVNFEIQPGEVVGVVGRNGAGKSTLLKILSRITAPTGGRIEVRGRLASLLEVGTGFHPELSGRENVFLNGAILGMSRSEVARKFDEIVAFAEVDKFIDTPVKRYSSGMYVRLAFAVAAHLETDILLVDEVLAVGDTAFQRKSLGKMSDVASRGRTVIFVSHNLAAMRNFCTNVILLERGSVTFDGSASEGIKRYESSFGGQAGLNSSAVFSGDLTAKIVIDGLVYLQDGQITQSVDPLRPMRVEIRGKFLTSFQHLNIKLSFFRDGIFLSSCHDTTDERGVSEGRFTSSFDFTADVFRPGRYTIGIGAAGSTGSWMWGGDVGVIDFSDNTGGQPVERGAGLIAIPYSGNRYQAEAYN